MATDLENLQTFRSNILTELAAITVTKSYTIDGKTVDHNAYRASLLANLREVNEQISEVEGPWEDNIQGVSG